MLAEGDLLACCVRHSLLQGVFGNMNGTTEYLSLKDGNHFRFEKENQLFYSQDVGTQDIYSGSTKSAKLKA